MNFKARLATVCLFDDVLQRIESRLETRVFGPGLHATVEVRVPATSDLNDECVEVALARVRYELVNLARILETVMESIHPESSQLSLILIGRLRAYWLNGCRQE